MKKKIADKFSDEDGKRYHFVSSLGTQSIALYDENEKKVLFVLDFKNSYKMFEALELSIEYIEREEPEEE